jgi:opacity protein-like surface antigen
MNSLKIGAAMVALVGMNTIAATADAGEWYGAVRVGQSQADVSGISFEEGLSYGGAVGTSVGPVRVEAGVNRLSGDFAGVVNADALDWNATAYLDLPVGDNASVYAGAGLDYVDGSASIYGYDIDASGDGYHWTIGAAYRLNANMIGEVQYTSTTADLDTDFGGVDLDASNISVGVRFAL